MQGGDFAKSFLEKLKFGGTSSGASIDNSAPPDNDGTIIRRLEREFASEPLSALGLRLTDDGEVLSTEANSPASRANIPPHYMLISLNNQFVGSRADFEELASQHLTLVMKLQTTAAMTELLAKVLEDEEKAEAEQTAPRIDFNELLRTTPRFGFLSSNHPMFLRWMCRLNAQREVRQLLRKATRDVEAQQAKEAIKKIRQMEAEEARQLELQQQQKQQQQQQQQQQQRNEQLGKAIEEEPENEVTNHEDKFLLKQVQDESAFNCGNDDNKEIHIREEEITEVHDVNEKTSAEELLKLIGVKPKEESVMDTSNGVALKDDDVRFFIAPTEEYILSNGIRVTIGVKQRSGPIPNPPPGRPPKGLRMLQLKTSTYSRVVNEESTETCSFCHVRGHTVERCKDKREQERRLTIKSREREVCRDYWRGRCTRSDCVMRHISGSRKRSRSPRASKRRRGSRHRSRDSYRHGNRRRRHESRRRERSSSVDRYHRRK